MKQLTFEDPTIYIAEGARIVGNVTLGARTGVWYNAVLRGDITSITVGEDCNIQDNVVIHGDEVYDVRIGDRVTAETPLCTLYARTEEDADAAERAIRAAVSIGREPCGRAPIFYAEVTAQGTRRLGGNG